MHTLAEFLFTLAIIYGGGSMAIAMVCWSKGGKL